MCHRIIVLWVSVILCVTEAVAQNKVSGRVFNSASGEVVPFANVFFAGSTFGATANEHGVFSFEGFPDGKYDLTVTHVGYEHYQLALDFTTADDIQHDIRLKESAIKLKEVVIYENASARREYMQYFLKYFIGTTRNSARCRITNPDVIHFYFDETERILTATAEEPLIIENKALGYRINYFLDTFEYRLRQGLVYSFGIPQFEEMKPGGENEKSKWEERRREAYAGSVNHFMRSLLNRATDEQGFQVRRITPIRNRRRPDQKFIDEHLARLKTLAPPPGSMRNHISDSLDLFRRLNSYPPTIDSLGTPITGVELFPSNSGSTFNYTGKLNVVYLKEKEEQNFVTQSFKSKRDPQKSLILFLDKQLKLYPNGYYENVKSVIVEGYWGWAENIANTLPTDYQPK